MTKDINEHKLSEEEIKDVHGGTGGTLKPLTLQCTQCNPNKVFLALNAEQLREQMREHTAETGHTQYVKPIPAQFS